MKRRAAEVHDRGAGSRRAVDWTGSFALAFLVSAAASLVAGLFWLLVIRQVTPVVWADDQSTALVMTASA